MLALSLSEIRRVRPSLSPAGVRHALLTALKLAGERGRRGITVVWTGEAEIRRLNRRHRGRDSFTDVLSFPLPPSRGWPAPAEPIELGDIVISLVVARRRARRFKRSEADQCRLLLVHGALHLLGFDHLRPADRRRMFRLQNRALDELGAGTATRMQEK